MNRDQLQHIISDADFILMNHTMQFTKKALSNEPRKEDSQASMKAILGIGPKTGKRSWEYYKLPEKKEEE